MLNFCGRELINFYLLTLSLALFVSGAIFHCLCLPFAVSAGRLTPSEVSQTYLISFSVSLLSLSVSFFAHFDTVALFYLLSFSLALIVSGAIFHCLCLPLALFAV